MRRSRSKSHGRHSAVADFRGALVPGSSKLGHGTKGGELGDHHARRLAFLSNATSTTLLSDNPISPTSVQLNSEIHGAFPCKRHQMQHLEFCTTIGKALNSWINVPFFLAGSLKIPYDLLLYNGFVSVPPVEEQS
jgi:hypothetical protein